MQLSDAPYKFTYTWALTASGSFITNPIPPTAATPAASQTLGFPPETASPPEAGGTPPNINDFNGVFRYLSLWTQWQQAGNAVVYDSTFQTNISGYPKNALIASVSYPGVVWQSTVENNVTNPDAAGAGWVQYPPHGAQTFSASGNFTVPVGVTRFRVRAWAAGGGSGGTFGSGSASSGGGGGGYAEGLFTSTPGTVFAVVIGTGGLPGAATNPPTNGTAGGATSFDAIFVSGGSGGPAGNATVGGPAAPGGPASGGYFNVPGGTASGGAQLPGAAMLSSAGGMSFGGMMAHFGPSGVSANGIAGLFPGGGAAGSVNQADGALGSNGFVIVEW